MQYFVDSELITDGALTLEEIVAKVSRVEEEPVITRQKAQAAFNVARRFVEKNSADPAILSHSDALDEFFYKERKNVEKQSQLTDFLDVL